MRRLKYTFELLTPCFNTGADPLKGEIRASSIRGQLRWWFRTLGGFRSMAELEVREQEALLFGSAAGEEGTSGALSIRVINVSGVAKAMDSEDLKHVPFTSSAYLSFPLQTRPNLNGKRGAYNEGTTFDVEILVRSNAIQREDLEALIVVFGNLGSLGFRSRRAFGALALTSHSTVDLKAALGRFQNSQSLIIKYLPADNAKHAFSTLGGWYQSCRAHGQSGKNEKLRNGPYFEYALNDHDIGYGIDNNNPPAYRPALGLPIIQRTRNATRNWDWNRKVQGAGRFASPVLLRPHRDQSRQWKALVIFVDAHKWPEGKQAYMDNQPREVSTELYEAMKHDRELENFL